jgi:putative transposase
MKKRVNEERIIQIRRAADVTGNNLEVCRQYGISAQRCYHWRRRSQGLSVSELQRRKRLESENTKLKRLVAEPALARQHLQERLPKKGLR